MYGSIALRSWVTALLVFLVPVSLFGQDRPEEGTRRSELLALEAEILELSGADTLSEVEPETLPLGLRERLGREVMATMVDDPDWHEWMNEMMGGEGSEHLAEMHRGIGDSYIDRGGELPEWDGPFSGPGMMTRGRHRWFMRPLWMLRSPLGAALLLGLLLASVLALLFWYRARRRRR